jgi:hypothetical protein
MIAHPTRFVHVILAKYTDNKVLYLKLGAWHVTCPNAKRMVLDEIFKFGTFNAFQP